MYIATGGSIDLVVWVGELNVTGAEQLLAFVVGLVLLVVAAVLLYHDAENQSDRRCAPF